MNTKAWDISTRIDNSICQILALADLLGAVDHEALDEGTLPYVAAIFERLGGDVSRAVEDLHDLAAGDRGDA